MLSFARAYRKATASRYLNVGHLEARGPAHDYRADATEETMPFRLRNEHPCGGGESDTLFVGSVEGTVRSWRSVTHLFEAEVTHERKYGQRYVVYGGTGVSVKGRER